MPYKMFIACFFASSLYYATFKETVVLVKSTSLYAEHGTTLGTGAKYQIPVFNFVPLISGLFLFPEGTHIKKKNNVDIPHRTSLS